MQRMSLRRAIGLGAALATVTFGGAYAIGATAASNAAPVEESGKPATVPVGPAALPSQAADRARQAIDERGRDAHAQGPRDDATETAPVDEVGEGPGYGPGVHAGPHGDYGPDVHPDSESHPGATDHPDADNHPDTTNHPGGQPTELPT
jgi:hypothetical protein